MNLIEKLGLEKCKQIVSDPLHLQMTHVSNDGRHWVNEEFSYIPEIQDQIQKMIRIADLRTAIADHEKCQHEWNETTSNGDAYRFFVCKHCDSTQNYVPFKDDNPSHFDHCADIRNHISPLTGVIER